LIVQVGLAPAGLGVSEQREPFHGDVVGIRSRQEKG